MARNKPTAAQPIEKALRCGSRVPGGLHLRDKIIDIPGDQRRLPDDI
jgi:hypothetical protein